MELKDWIFLIAQLGGIILLRQQNKILSRQQGNMDKYNPAPARLTWRNWSQKYWTVLFMIVLMLSCWVPYFLTPKLQPDFFESWGIANGRVYAIVRTVELKEKRPDRLMMIAMVVDNSVDYKTDTRIAKSPTFEIQDFATQIEIILTPEIQATLHRPGLGSVYILEVTKDFPFETIRHLADAEKLGGKILGSKAFGNGIGQSF